ncbi:hypothetical protein HPB52_012531 [Rhipicephalus sanguineus]|uniref:Uncharacterized protein n=1 Tax=Rhipicephalus sanguineus TaxID=34632 RepID=A0A9D4YP91_RHISA|nr:hypothetical protein HPB52_012531 [Rhipicephalus sanguineus]
MSNSSICVHETHIRPVIGVIQQQGKDDEPRIEVGEVTLGTDNVLAGSLTVYGGGQYHVKTTVADEVASYEITDEKGQTRNILVAVPKPPVEKIKFERRIILENGVETIEEYQNNKMVRRIVDGQEAPVVAADDKK